MCVVKGRTSADSAAFIRETWMLDALCARPVNSSVGLLLGRCALLPSIKKLITLRFMDVKEIESAITRLPPSQLVELAKWFEEFQAQAWDKRLEQDVEAGRFDALLEEVEQEFEAGRCEPL